MSLVTLALLVAVVTIAASIAFAVVRTIALFRTVGGFLRATGEGADALGRSLDRLSAFDAPDLDRASTAFARMESSRARLGVLTGALGRVRGQWSGLLAVYPKK